MSTSRTVMGGRDSAVATYEELRCRVRSGGNARDCDLGQIFLFREGIVAWMAHGTTSTAPADLTVDWNRQVTAPVLSNEIHASIVRALANMALAARGREMTT